MNRLRPSNSFEFFRRPKVRRAAAAFAGGTAICGAIACSPPALSTPEPAPSNVIQVEAPTCTLDRTHFKGRKYDFEVKVENPGDLDISHVTYDFGNGVVTKADTDEIVRYTYPEGGNWSARAVLQIAVPEGVRYNLDSYQVVCYPDPSTPPNIP